MSRALGREEGLARGWRGETERERKREGEKEGTQRGREREREKKREGTAARETFRLSLRLRRTECISGVLSEGMKDSPVLGLMLNFPAESPAWMR